LGWGRWARQVFEQQAAFKVALNSIGTRMGWDNERYSWQRKIPYTYHPLVLGYPIPSFLILGYLSLFWDIPGISQKPQKIPLGLDDIQHLVISLAYPWYIPEISQNKPIYPRGRDSRCTELEAAPGESGSDSLSHISSVPGMIT
jgi:hypothetical protein